MIIQNFAGLEATYSKEVAQTLRANCNNLIYLLTTELGALEEISKLCGEKRVKVGKGDKQHEETRPLITVSELQLMKEDEAIIIRTRQRPYKTKYTKNYQIDWGDSKYKAEEFIHREKKSLQVFDVREFVKEKRKDKFMNMMDGDNPMGGMNPFGPAIPPIPNNNPPINVDDLVKKIDQKIAELEAEEKQKEEEEKTKKKATKQQPISIKPIDETSLVDNKIVLEPEEENKVVKGVSDDQFFDDFFDE